MPDELHETLTRISNYIRQAASRRVSHCVDDGDPEHSQTIKLSNTVTELSNPEIASTKTAVNKNGCPIQLAAFPSGLNNLPSEQQLNVAAVTFLISVIANNTPHSFAVVNNYFSAHTVSSVPLTHQQVCPRISVLSQTQQSLVPVTTQPQISIPSSHAVPNMYTWTFPSVSKKTKSNYRSGFV